MKNKKLINVALTIVPLCMVTSLAFADIWYNRVNLRIQNTTKYPIKMRARDTCAGRSAANFDGKTVDGYATFEAPAGQGNINWDDNLGSGRKVCGGKFATVDIRFYLNETEILYYQYKGPTAGGGGVLPKKPPHSHSSRNREASWSWNQDENIFNWWEPNWMNIAGQLHVSHDNPANNQPNRPVTATISLTPRSR